MTGLVGSGEWEGALAGRVEWERALAGRGEREGALASCLGWEGHHQVSAHRIASLELDGKEDDDQSCTWGMTWDYPESGPDHPSWYIIMSEVYESNHVKRCTACEYSSVLSWRQIHGEEGVWTAPWQQVGSIHRRTRAGGSTKFFACRACK